MKHNMNQAMLIFGSQLVDPKSLPIKAPVYMAEDLELCTYFQFHKIKISFFLSSMRHYKLELEKNGFSVHYQKLPENKTLTFEQNLEVYLKQNKITELHFFEIEDKFMESRVQNMLQRLNLKYQIHPNPQFLTLRDDFKKYLTKNKKPFLKTFYESQRKSLKVLMDEKGKPTGGKYSFDEDNRLKLPTHEVPIAPTRPRHDKIDQEVFTLVEKRFSKHPGDLKEFWLPTQRAQAQDWLQEFLQDRMEKFGPYEDALSDKSDFVYHSALSPLMNVGLITPLEIITTVQKMMKKSGWPLASVEGFVRQIIGWREFIRGIYQNFSEQQETKNFFNHQRKLKKMWWEGTTGIPPLDDCIHKAQRLSYNHHIERLMVICNLMNLCEIHPQEVHRWFMEMYVDSSDWVMGPNVYGMGLFSDGGIFATKPYTCGSNYFLKMSSDYKKGAWCDIVDGLYWRFIDKHRDFYLRNPRTSMSVRTFDKLDPARKKIIFKAAETFLQQSTS